MLYFLIFLIIVAGDQALKWWTVEHLALYESAPLLPGVVEFRYIQNTGGGWSILSEHTWLLSALTAVIVIVLAALMLLRIVRHPIGMTACTMLAAGGVGNLLDRVRLGYVVDMFHFEFWQSYPVFNIADIFVVVGMIFGCVYYLFLYDKYDAPKKEKADGADDPAEHK